MIPFLNFQKRCNRSAAIRLGSGSIVPAWEKLFRIAFGPRFHPGSTNADRKDQSVEYFLIHKCRQGYPASKYVNGCTINSIRTSGVWLTVWVRPGTKLAGIPSGISSPMKIWRSFRCSSMVAPSDSWWTSPLNSRSRAPSPSLCALCRG